jgi:hypothetical protein
MVQTIPPKIKVQAIFSGTANFFDLPKRQNKKKIKLAKLSHIRRCS